MPHLFDPLQLRGLTIRNRIAVSPMQQYMTPEGIIGDWHMVHLGSKAVGGAGLIIAESTAVRPDGRATLDDTGLWNDAQMESWKPIVKFAQDWGAKMGIQLGHFGSKGSRSHPRDGFNPMPQDEGGWPLISSSTQTPFPGMLTPHALSLEEIEEVQSDFVMAAKRAVEAGFDTIELHGAHGYLFHQFYSALVNDRNDRYGGSLENRIRFMVETAEKVRAVIPDEMPLLARISAVDYSDMEGAWDVDQSIGLVKALKEAGVDFVTASAGGFVYVSKDQTHPGYQVPFAEEIQKATGLPMGAVGLITDAGQANEIIENERASMVVIGRAFLKDPHLPLHWAEDLGYRIELPFPYKRGWVRVR
jgi:2,4-dienoyl-CoA reductase-like NADH-dependent reductase (Old Yellow Enzyme family)